MMTGKVVKINSEIEIVVNFGSKNGDIRLGQKFKVIKLGENVIDPDTNQELGKLEMPCGIVEVINIQENMSTLQSCEYLKSPDKKEVRTIKRASPFEMGSTETIETITPGSRSSKPLKNLEIGNIVISIN